jgi:thioredoxin 1
MITYATDENYEELVKEGVVLVDFFGVTCGPCKMLARVLEELEDEFPFINIVKVDVEQCPKKAEEFEIMGIPDLYYYKDGQVVFHETGAVNGEEIRGKLAEILY